MPEISPTVLAQVADYFKVLSEVSRLQILNCLRSGAKNVTEIVEATGLSQANTSRHLQALMQARMISRQARGVSAYYQISDPMIFELCDLVCDRLAARLLEQTKQLEQFKKSS
jgi:DNA-binding transcriptional ArsR family regulator